MSLGRFLFSSFVEELGSVLFLIGLILLVEIDRLFAFLRDQTELEPLEVFFAEGLQLLFLRAALRRALRWHLYDVTLTLVRLVLELRGHDVPFVFNLCE